MSIVRRVIDLQLPLDQIVVIGSGLLDAYGLRESSDVDLVASKELFKKLEASGKYNKEIRPGGPVLLDDDLEVWLDWGETYEELAESAVTVEGVRFMNPQLLIAHKKQTNREKDQRDVALLQEYLHGRS